MRTAQPPGTQLVRMVCVSDSSCCARTSSSRTSSGHTPAIRFGLDSQSVEQLCSSVQDADGEVLARNLQSYEWRTRSFNRTMGGYREAQRRKRDIVKCRLLLHSRVSPWWQRVALDVSKRQPEHPHLHFPTLPSHLPASPLGGLVWSL